MNKNGLEQVVSDLTEELVRMGHEVTLFATADSKTRAKLIPLWPTAVSRDPYEGLMNKDAYAMWAVSEAFLQSSRFDIIHDHTRYISGHFAGLIKTPVITTIHHPVSVENAYVDSFPVSHRPFLDHIIERNRQFAHIVMVSEFQKSQYRHICQVIPNGIEIDRFEFSNNPGEYFGYLGYITADKGAAEAVQAVLPTNEKLIIAGPIRDDDPMSQKYFDTKIKPYLNDRIQYIGPLDFDQKVKFLKDAKATLMPIQWDEPFGLVAIESLAAGTPVVAWNRAAMPEIITPDSGMLVNSLAELTTSLPKIESINRAACRRRVEENFTSKIMAEKYVELYKSLLH